MIRLLGRGGTDLPGRIALKLCPNLLGVLAKNVTTVIVTGTNGKTTTSRMIEQSLSLIHILPMRLQRSCGV